MSANTDHYWTDNIRLILKLLFIWFLVSFVLASSWLNHLTPLSLPALRLGFGFHNKVPLFRSFC